MKPKKNRIVVGITGATGVIYGIRLLEVLRDIPDVEAHVILSEWAKETIRVETGRNPAEVEALAAVSHPCRDMGANVASGSFLTEAMIIVPCSMKTLSAVAGGYADNLITRAADVTLKESRRLILCPRETPLTAIHLENMLKLSRLGVRIIPPTPAFYHLPKTIDDITNHYVHRLLNHLGVAGSHIGYQWQGIENPAETD
jgi:4-hydroxy-3-polyprenylbenzoate decarboxylase